MRTQAHPKRSLRVRRAALSLAALLGAAGAQAQPSMSCEAARFARLDLPRTRIVSATAISDDPRAGAHCVLRGAVNERTGTDGRPYAIGFEMRLPDRWNGRYFDQVNGGNDGAVVPAYGNLGGNQPDNALARGYATLSSDSGHDGQANPEAGLVGGNLFGFDAQARLDYGYAANVTLTPIAKTIIEHYYGRRPEYSYMVGCSNGGRHAFVGATRLADEFDGFLAGAPGYNLPMVGLQHAWDVQSFDRAGGDIRRALSLADMQARCRRSRRAVRRARRRGRRHRRRDRGLPADLRSQATPLRRERQSPVSLRTCRSRRSSARLRDRRTARADRFIRRGCSMPVSAPTTGVTGSSKVRFPASKDYL